MPERFLCGPKQMRFAFVEQLRNSIPTERLCRIVNVTPRVHSYPVILSGNRPKCRVSPITHAFRPIVAEVATQPYPTAPPDNLKVIFFDRFFKVKIFVFHSQRHTDASAEAAKVNLLQHSIGIILQVRTIVGTGSMYYIKNIVNQIITVIEWLGW